MHAHQPIVTELIALLAARPDLSKALDESVRKADWPGVRNHSHYLAFLDRVVTMIPIDRNLNRYVDEFFYLVDQSPNDILQIDASFQTWMHKFCASWGAFLDTPASAKDVPSFFGDPAYHIGDYYVAPSGWLTFNQFFARQVRPGKRPIDGLCDPSIIVSPADSVFQGHWDITPTSTVTAKGFTWSIHELLKDSPFRDKFTGGVFTHSFLNVNDYHRFHVPVAGVVREVRKIPGRISMDVRKKPDGSLETVDGASYQYTQDRGLLVLETALGMVAVLPIGMAQVSSVTLTAELGAELHKGQEFGFFQFGGSDIVMLFEAGKVELNASIGVHYNQGKQLGHVIAA